MQEWLFLLPPALVTLVFVVLVFRRLPWPQTRSIRHESRWTGTTSIEFEPQPAAQLRAQGDADPQFATPERPAPSPAPLTSEEAPRTAPHCPRRASARPKPRRRSR